MSPIWMASERNDSNYECGARNDFDHALVCKLGGFVIMRHNAVRDIEADFLRYVCKDVSVEPGLIQST